MRLESEWRHARKRWSWEFEDFEKESVGSWLGPCRQTVGLPAIEADSWSWVSTMVLRSCGLTRQLGFWGWTIEDDSWVPAVIYWPSTEPSIKRCPSVNKRKNSGSRWMLENNITRCPGGSSQLETGCQRENQLQTEGFGHSVTHCWATPAKMRKKCCYGREKNLGQYSSPSLSPLISHTQQTSTFRK